MTATRVEARQPTGPAPPSSLWHNRDCLKIWLGETVSLHGSQVTNLALPRTAVLVFNASDRQVGRCVFCSSRRTSCWHWCSGPGSSGPFAAAQAGERIYAVDRGVTSLCRW